MKKKIWFNLQKPSVYTLSRLKGCEVHVDICHISLFRSKINTKTFIFATLYKD